MSDWDFPGAKWWKFDFHTHTPASRDFLEGCSDEDKNIVTPRYWLQKFMEKKIDCVAVTDHNSGKWIDRLKDALNQIESNPPDWYHHLCLFPGVEISANGGVHVLAIFDPNKTGSDIDSLLGAVGYLGTKGESGAVTEKSLTEVINEIVNYGGIAIPAHVDNDAGLFKLKGKTLEQVLNNSNIHAIELCDKNFPKPQMYHENKISWTEVCGSDTHNFRRNKFGYFTWVKMDEPSIEGLKLALIDGSPSVNGDRQASPNRHSAMIIEKICVEDAKHIGILNPLEGNFSPWLNAIIGSRGSGKSTLLEFMRLILRRKEELPRNLMVDIEKYFLAGGKNLLTEDSKLSLIYRKEGTRYKLNWSVNAELPSLEVYENDNWHPEDGEIRSLFPVSIYSQKQIYALAQQPDALLRVIDQDPQVRRANFIVMRKVLNDEYVQADAKIRQLSEQVSKTKEIKGNLNDISRQIKQIEMSGHKDILQNYRARKQQEAAIDRMESDWQDMLFAINEVTKQVSPASFDSQDFAVDQDIVKIIEEFNGQWQDIHSKIMSTRKDAQTLIDKWQKEKGKSKWLNELNVDIDKYKLLRSLLEQQGINPGKYPHLLQQQEQCKRELENIEGIQIQIEEHEQKKSQVLRELQENRMELTSNRRNFLESTLKDNQSVNIEVVGFGQTWEDVENNIRQMLQCGDRFYKDIEKIKEQYTSEEDKDKSIAIVKKWVIDIKNGKQDAQDKRFADHVRQLPQESISDLMCWFPDDGLKITYGNNQDIQQGSPGQKTAALLAFILSYGTEPLLLDQPEDDLDNELIYSLIVQQLRDIKTKRQIIVITHNANIVVNGDAEMVLPLSVGGGQSKIDSAASIQNHKIREKICDVLEGGKRAFEQRYKRIHLN